MPDNGFLSTTQMAIRHGETPALGAFCASNQFFETLTCSHEHSVNGGTSVLVDQPNTGGGHVLLSVPVKLTLKSGANTITVGASQSSESSFSKMGRYIR